MKKIIIAVIIGYSIPNLLGMEARSNEISKRTYTSTQVTQFYALESWYTSRLQQLIDSHFDQQIDRANFDSKAQKLYNNFKTGKDRILSNKKQRI
ncbi:hypothetical protein HYX58_05085 [Candidatus Dependentiae bacterium]|nr:hypothetical protein [Candidatus Dependentiae bacterium]